VGNGIPIVILYEELDRPLALLAFQRLGKFERKVYLAAFKVIQSWLIIMIVKIIDDNK
jgi:hypothetical protein